MAKAVVEMVTPVALNFNSQSFAQEPSPFEQGMIVAFTGSVGTGKTHLMEATINAITKQLGPAKGFAYLCAGNLRSEALTYGVGNSGFSGKPLVFLDDAFNEHKTSADVDAKSAEIMMGIVSTAYNNKRIIVMSSNFSIEDVLMPLMRKQDAVGRTLSRCAEILAEVKIEGPDGRLKIGQSGGALARLLKKPAAP